VVHTELLRYVGLPWCQWLEADGCHALVMGAVEFASGLDTSGGVLTLAVWIPTSTGWGERVWVVPA
jgi:hypothetical protein